MGKKISKLSPGEVEELTQLTHFTPKELNRWYTGFLNDCPSGTLKRDEFCKIYSQFFPFGDPSAFAGFVFQAFDANQDGEIEFREFVTALSVTSRGSLEEKLQWSFQLYDHNHDGYITKEEVTAVVDAMHKMTGTMVDFDNDQETPQERVKKIFETMDTDEEGRISLQDFLQSARSDPTIVQALTVYEGLL